MSENTVAKLVYKIGQCIDYQSLYAMEELFNKCGLTIQTTSRNRMILCKLRDGQPISKDIIDDYIFVGSLDVSDHEMTDRAIEKICDFVNNNHGKADTVKNVAKVWRNGLRIYDASIFITNEDQQRVVGEMIID